MEYSQAPTEEQRRLLCEMMHGAFLEVRRLAWEGKSQQAADLAYAFHNLPVAMYSADFSWTVLRQDLETYQREYPRLAHSGRDYLAMLDFVEGTIKRGD